MEESQIPSSTLSSSAVRIAVRCARVAVFLLAFLLTLEVATRIEQRTRFGAPLLSRYTYDSVLYTVDDHGIKGKPNATFEKWHLNSLGFRGPEFDPEKSPGRLRIACIGASETFGLFEQAGNEWPRQLERILNERGIEAEVINAALAGMSLQQRLIHLQNRLLQFQPDIVILMLEYNSYAGITPAKIETKRVARTVPLPAKHDTLVEGIKSLRLSTALKYSLIPKLPQRVQDMYSGWDLNYKLWQREQDLGSDFRSYHNVTELEIQTFRDDILQFQTVAAQHDIVLILASPAEWLNEQNILGFYASWPYIDESWHRQALATFPKVAKEFAQQRYLPFVDLQEVVASREPTFLKDMVHYSDEGARVVGETFGKVILEMTSPSNPTMRSVFPKQN
ncbi:MAG: SGNH/GDSL hydrolase family protein [Nitrospiraceae bacterium]